MKLAEALVLRADAQKRFEQLQERIIRNAKVQAGDAPAEDPTGLLSELEQAAVEMTGLIQKINRTNSATIFEGNQTLADVLGERDVLLKRCTAYRHLAQMASITQNVYSKSEVKFVSTVNVGDVQKRADELSKAYRELDCQIQELNWKTELLN